MRQEKTRDRVERERERERRKKKEKKRVKRASHGSADRVDFIIIQYVDPSSTVMCMLKGEN